jgi:hypothetical protein
MGMTRLPDAEHLGRPWRIHEIAAGFALEDVWALPTPGGPGDFPKLVAGATAMDPERSGPLPVRALFAIRWAIGGLLGWDDEDTGAGSRVPSLRDRVPADLRGTADGVDFAGLPFSPLYLTGDEFAAEIANATVHGVLHLGWVPDGTGAWRGQMAVLVKRNGRLGAAYMAAIAPFRHLVVYPPMIRHVGRQWEREVAA